MNPFAEAIERSAREFGDRAYLTTVSGNRLSFAEFRDRTLRLAGALVDLGVRPDDRIALLTDNRPEFVIGWYAGQVVGATVSAINHSLPADSQDHLLGVVAPRLCLVSSDRPLTASLAVLDRRGIGCHDLERLIAGARSLAHPVDLEPTHRSQIVFSSGTTGRPKGAVHRAERVLGSLNVARRIGLTTEDRLLVTAPMFHGLGQSWSHYGLALGATVVIAPGFSASQHWARCREHGVTVMHHVGAMLSYLTRAEPSADDARNPVRLSFGVGAPAPVWTAFEERFGVDVVEYYGTTEVGLVTFNPAGERPGSVGRAAAHDIRLVDASGRDVPDGSPGELWSRPRGPEGSAAEYFDDPEATAAAESDGWFRTGDVLSRDAEGYYYFVGRAKDTLRRRGENLVPEDVERGVRAVPGVVDCAAVAAPSEHGDDEIRLCLVLDAAAARLGRAELAARLCAAVPAVMRPRYLCFHDRLPYTATSKLQRGVLRSAAATCWDVEAEWSVVVGSSGQ